MPMASAPEVHGIGVGLVTGEVDLALVLVEDLDMPTGTQIPKLDELVRPEDLSLTITGAPPARAAGQVGEGK